MPSIYSMMSMFEEMRPNVHYFPHTILIENKTFDTRRYHSRDRLCKGVYPLGSCCKLYVKCEVEHVRTQYAQCAPQPAVTLKPDSR